MRRQLFTPFLRGARLGFWVGAPTLVLSLLLAVVVLTLQPGIPAGGPADAEGSSELVVASDAPHPSTVTKKRPLAEDRIDRGLREAARRARAGSLEGVPFELSTAADIPFPPDGAPEPPPAAAEVAPPAPAIPAAPPVVVDGDALRATLAEYFPEQVDRAYGIVMCESSGNARAISRSGTYHGMWQFDLATWQSVGGSGSPSQASVEEQMMRARMLYEARGWSPWGCA